MASDFSEQFPVGFRVGFNANGTAEPRNPYVDSPNPSLTVDVSAFRTVDGRPADATEYPEDLGYPAYQAVINEGGPDIDALLVYEFSGLGLQIMPAELPSASTRDEKLTRAAEIFRTITAYPGAASDQSAWGAPIVP
jgi:hypothetical protein